MYAAAGGASIASRRKQKRLLLHKRGGAAGPPGGTGRGCPPVTTSAEHHAPRVPGGNFHQANPRIRSAPSHPGRPRISRPPNLPAPTLINGQHHSHQPRSEVQGHHHQQLIIPVSPITFPISPPPLSISLESSNSLNNYSVSKSNHFPFPPPSDLRVSSTELQCTGQSQAQGKAAWQGCSRPSPLPLTPVSPGSRTGEGSNYKTKQCEAHRRWMKRNRIRDASYCYGSSGEEEEDGPEYRGRRRGEVSAAVNTVLYAGLGTTALGLVISFVGTGEKGFQSSELRLVGPSLLCAGLLCCLLRVLLCLCLCHCGDCQWRKPQTTKAQKSCAPPASKDQNSVQAPSQLLTASLLTPMRATVSPQPPVQKGRELLLSAAQLSE